MSALDLGAPTNAVSPDALTCQADERRRVAEALIARGELASALETLRHELELRRRLAAHDPADPDRRAQVSRVAARIAEVLVFRSGVAVLRQGVNGAASSDAGAARVPAAPHDISWTLRSAGSRLAAQGDAPGALALHHESLAIRRELAAGDPKNAALRLDISWSLAAIADILDAKGDLDEALAALRESLAIRRALSAAEPGNDGLRCDMAASLTRIADILAEQEDRPGALAAYREARDIACALQEREPGAATRHDDVATIDARIAAMVSLS